MSMGTLDALCDPHFVPDVAVIARGCLEFDVSLESVTRDEDVARDYLEFDKEAKAHYLRLLRKQGDIDRLLVLREQFVQEFGEEPDGFGRNSWCARRGGITGLIEKFGRKNDRCLYNLLSQFAHGSIWAVQTLDGRILDPVGTLAMIVNGTYARYLRSSQSFVRFAWEPLTTPEGERCKSDFVSVLQGFFGEQR